MSSGLKRRLRRQVSRAARVVRSWTGRPCVCRVGRCTILLSVDSEVEQFRADTYSTKEPETLEWIDRLIRPGDVLYDIGANIGLYSLYAARRLECRSKVYAFEPEALNHAKLSRNILLNGLSGVVIPCCLAISDRLHFDRLYLHPNSSGMSTANALTAGSALHVFGSTSDFSGQPFKPCHQQGMVGVPIDHLWQTWGLEFPNHLKIDVDGTEESVIAGATATIADPRLKSVMVEVTAMDIHASPILQRMAAAGFRRVTDFRSHSSEQLRGTIYEQSVNCVFVRTERADSPA